MMLMKSTYKLGLGANIKNSVFVIYSYLIIAQEIIVLYIYSYYHITDISKELWYVLHNFS